LKKSVELNLQKNPLPLKSFKFNNLLINIHPNLTTTTTAQLNTGKLKKKQKSASSKNLKSEASERQQQKSWQHDIETQRFILAWGKLKMTVNDVEQKT
jgi:hypothetical protein